MNDEIFDRLEIEITQNRKDLYEITSRYIHNLYKVEGILYIVQRGTHI